MGKNEAGVATEQSYKGGLPAEPSPAADPSLKEPAPGAGDLDLETIDEQGGEGKHVPVGALIKMRQERNKFRDEIAGLKDAGVSDGDMKKAMRETIVEMAGEEEEARRQAAAEAEAAEGEDYDWRDSKLKPLDRRFQKLESENRGLRERLDKGDIASETVNVRKETDAALAKFPKARRKEVLSEAYLHPEKPIMEIAEASHKEMEDYNAGIVNAYATDKGNDNKGGGGPSGGQPPVPTTDMPDIEDNTKGFVSRLKEKLKLSV